MIDSGLPPTWPAEVVSSLRNFSQGDLVEAPPFFYAGTARYGLWELTREFGDSSLDDEIFELDVDFRPPYGLITTETCDLIEEDRSDSDRRQPWFSIAPVYDLTNLIDPTRIDLLDRNRLAFFRRLRGNPLGEGIWVVDARIEVPIEKSWLSGRSPITVLTTFEERSEMAGFLAGRRDRPVLGADLQKALIRYLRRWIEKMNPERRAQALDGVAEVRLLVSGDPLDPDGVALILVLEDSDETSAVSSIWEAKWESFRSRCEEVGISLVANSYETLDSLSARRYRESYRIPLEF